MSAKIREEADLDANSDSRLRWYTIADLADRWRITTRTLHRWRAQRFGPAWHLIGGKVLYSANDITAYESKRRRKGD